jgi:hypothetical protein
MNYGASSVGPRILSQVDAATAFAWFKTKIAHIDGHWTGAFQPAPNGRLPAIDHAEDPMVGENHYLGALIHDNLYRASSSIVASSCKAGSLFENLRT